MLAREAAGGFGNSAKQMTDCIAAAESAEGTPYARSADAPLSMQSDVNSEMADCIAAAMSAEGTPYARSADAPLSMQSDVNSINSKKRGEKSESNLTAGR